MWSCWNSTDALSVLGSIARWIAAIAAIFALLFAHRISALQKREKEPRVITPEQRTRFADFLANFDKGKVEFRCIISDDEAVNFTSSLKAMVEQAGFNVLPSNLRFISTGSHTSGIQIQVKDGSSQPRHAGNLQKAFESIGIACPASVSESLPDDAVVIFVYGKR